MIDLTNDEAQTTPQLLLAGTYMVRGDAGTVKATQNGLGSFLEVELVVTNGEHEGARLWHRFNLVNASEKATKIGRGQLKAFLQVGGHKDPNHLNSPAEVIGLRCLAKVTIKTDSTYGDKNEVKGFLPFPAEGATDPAAQPSTEFAHTQSFP